MQSQGRDGRFWPVLWYELLFGLCFLMLPAFGGHSWGAWRIEVQWSLTHLAQTFAVNRNDSLAKFC